MMLVAVSLFLLMGSAAIAVDLAAMRLDRSADQKVTDSAASAGALAVYDGTGQDGCEAALAYAAINAQEIGALDPSGCATRFSADCTPGEFYTVPSGRFTVTVTYPVADSDPLMTSSALGASAQTPVAEDGDPCERIGVQMSAVHEGLFARMLGFQQGTTTVHSVARAFLPPPDGPPINLLLLDRFGCGVMKASGSSNAGIIVDEIVDPATGEVFPGEGAVDSDASVTGGCPTDTGTIDIDGSNASIRADGPPNCGNPLEDPPGSGQGCGFLKTLAPGATGAGCNWPACTGGG
ncbi:MAG TPA: Tad domain-containing protein, partial [Acidimicrobiia bacterium]|nr:Tad domain-containing protein [Acidimicrobiia bacterium]